MSDQLHPDVPWQQAVAIWLNKIEADLLNPESSRQNALETVREARRVLTGRRDDLTSREALQRVWTARELHSQEVDIPGADLHLLDMPRRVMLLLWGMDIFSIDQVCQYPPSALLRRRHFGRASLAHLESALAKHGRQLKTDN